MCHQVLTNSPLKHSPAHSPFLPESEGDTGCQIQTPEVWLYLYQDPTQKCSPVHRTQSSIMSQALDDQTPVQPARLDSYFWPLTLSSRAEIAIKTLNSRCHPL